MNHARLAFVLVAVTAAPAFAQEGPGMVAPAPYAPAPVAPQPAGVPLGAPMTDAWSDVNHINGMPVKVGEKNEYLRHYKKTVIASNPIGWMVGVYGVSVSHAIHDNVAIRVDGNLYNNFFDEKMNGYEVGATFPIYFKRVYQGPFIEPGIVKREMTYSYDDYYYDENGGYTSTGNEEHTETFGPQVMFGWHQTFDSGLNVAAALGMVRDLNRQVDEYGYEEESIGFNGYFRVGYAF